MALVIDKNDVKRTSLYLVICLFVTVPVVFAVWNILFSTGLPVGADSADHTSFVMYILYNKDLLIPYSQFPVTTDNHETGYYPSLMHIILAAYTTVVSGIDEWRSIVEALQVFVFIQYITGIIGFALLIKAALDEFISTSVRDRFAGRNAFIAYIIILVLAFSLFFYSTSPIVKILRDGSYSQIFAMWCIFPFYIWSLIRRRWIMAAVLFTLILYAHNLSALMTGAATVAYLLGLVIRRDLVSNLKGITIGALILILLSVPAMIFFYIPSASSSVTGASGEAVPLSRDQIRTEITDLLFYTGLLSLIILLWIDYKKFAWVAIWAIFFILLSHSSLFGERFVRELTVPLGLIIGLMSGVLLMKFYIYLSAQRNIIRKYAVYGISFLAISLVVGSFFYYQERFNIFSNPVHLNYFSSAFAEANSFLLNQSQVNAGQIDSTLRPTIAVFGMNQWIKPATYGQYVPLEVLPSEDERYLSLNDRLINKQLHEMLFSDENAKKIAKKYNVEFVIINGLLQDRWYPQSYIDEYQSLQRFAVPDHLVPVKSIAGSEGEMIQIFRIKL